jgi:hypothetical protein
MGCISVHTYQWLGLYLALLMVAQSELKRWVDRSHFGTIRRYLPSFKERQREKFLILSREVCKVRPLWIGELRLRNAFENGSCSAACGVFVSVDAS